MWITMLLHRLGKDKRGFSTVIAVVLSLVILVVIVANVVMWNYTMSQADWERTKEDVHITNATRTTKTSWPVAQTEYSVNLGYRINGNYTNTRQADGIYESFVESSATQKSYLHRTELSGVNPTGKAANSTQPSLSQTETYYIIARGASVYFYSQPLPAQTLTSEIWTLYLWSSTETSGKSSTLSIQISLVSSDGSTAKATIGTVANIVVGYGFSERVLTTSGSTVSVATGDRIRLALTTQAGGSNDSQGMRFYYDGYGTYETRGHETRLLQGGYTLDLNGSFSIDSTASSLSDIKSVQVQIVYRANDTSERWYLKAYNWTAGSYGDSGFNNTLGNMPALAWNVYAVNVTKWNSYVNENGTLSLKFQDSLPDAAPTVIDVDYLAVEVTVNEAEFTFQNKGAVTLQLASLWIDNSTMHKRYEMDVFINAGDTATVVRSDVNLPRNAIIKVVTTRGNVAVYATN